MTNISKGIVAGLAATATLSTIMIAKGMMGLMPELNIIAMLSSMLSTAPVVGWVIHLAIGTLIWGVAFAVILKALPGNSDVAKGISFGIAAWIMMMLVIMPMAGAGLFGLNMGMMAPVMTLMLHAIYGAVLGFTYSRLHFSDGLVESQSSGSA